MTSQLTVSSELLVTAVHIANEQVPICFGKGERSELVSELANQADFLH